MKTLLIAHARFSSTRLPAKIVYPIAGRPMIAHVADRIQRCRSVDQVILATSTNPADDLVATWCDALNVPCFRGSETDVLSRFLAAARHFGADVVVRVCADAPLLDPAVIDAAVEQYRRSADTVDYVSNMMTRTFPRGESVEVMKRSVLETMDRRATEPHQREHVTPYLLEHRDEFRTADYLHTSDLSHMNWTVDTRADWEFVCAVYDRLYRENNRFGMDDVLRVLADDPALARSGDLAH